jgi:hypothetical protein
MVDRRLFSVVIQGYQLILQGIALKTCLILSSLLEPKWSQSVQNLSLPRFASNRNGSDTVRLDPAIFAVLPLSDPPLCFNTCVILRADNSSRLIEEYVRMFLRRYSSQHLSPKEVKLPLSAYRTIRGSAHSAGRVERH